MVEGGQCCIVHCVKVIRVGTYRLAIVGGQLHDSSLRKLAVALSSQCDTSLLSGGRQLPRGSTKSFGDVVDAFFFLQNHVAIYVSIAQVLICFGIAISNDHCIAETTFKRSLPQLQQLPCHRTLRRSCGCTHPCGSHTRL